MKIVELEQKTLEWVRWRNIGIGSSDAAALMGVDRYGKTRDDLIQYKAKQLTYSRTNTNTNWGDRCEPLVRSRYNTLTGLEVRPVCVIHDEWDWLRASLDGLSEDGKVMIEVKAVNQKLHRQALEGRVPDCFWPQVQHSLMVSVLSDWSGHTLERCDYLSYNESHKFGHKEHLVRIQVTPDLEYQKRLWEVERSVVEEINGQKETVVYSD